MKTLDELNAYLYALSLVNSNVKSDFWYHFEIRNIDKKGSVVESLSCFEKLSDDYDGYDKNEYEVSPLADGFDQLVGELDELFGEYLFWIIEHARLNLHPSESKYMRSALNDRLRENLLSKVFVDALVDHVGSDAKIFSIGVKEQEDQKRYSIFDVLWGEVYLIWGVHRACVLEISGND